MRLFIWLRGYLLVKLTGNEIIRFINICAAGNIKIENIRMHEDMAYAFLSIRDFKRLKEPAVKCSIRVKIVKRFGLPFKLQKLFKRKLLPVSIAAGILMIFILSEYVWNIDYTGNFIHTDEQLEVFLKENGIYTGCRKDKIDCNYIELKIREKYTDISWVSAELTGTKLHIRIEESISDEKTDKAVLEELSLSEGEYINIVAAKDGIIESIIVRHGRALVKEGDVVKKGDILVEGLIEKMNDNGEISGYLYTVADADIMMKTVIDYSDNESYEHIVREYSGNEKKGFEIYALGRKIFSYTPSNRYKECDIIAEVYQIKLGGNFYLPVYWKKVHTDEYKSVKARYTVDEAKEILVGRYERFVKGLEEEGIIIINKEEKYTQKKKALYMEVLIQTYEPAYYMVKTEFVKETEVQ